MCLQIFIRYLCSSDSTIPFEHCTFLGTHWCSRDPRDRKGACPNEAQAWFFAPLLGGICLQCVEKLYPEWFENLKEKSPENYTQIAGHEELPIPDKIKQDMLMWDQVSNLYIAEKVGLHLINDGVFKPQTIFDKDCNVISVKDDIQHDQSYEALVKSAINIGGEDAVTLEDMHKAMLNRMEMWMTVFHANQSEMDKAYNMLKRWRFEMPAKDDIFDRRFAITKMVDFKLDTDIHST
jgi:hypothetical protein